LLSARYLRQRCLGLMCDPATALHELPLLRKAALERGYPEQALWTLLVETELKHALNIPDGMRALAHTAARLAEPLGVGNEIFSTMVLCYILAREHDWSPLLDAASEALRLIRERGAMRLAESLFLAHIGAAQLALGNPEAGRAAAVEGVACMLASQSAYNPRSYAVLARAQLALNEPAADIASTLDEYAALLERTGFHLYEGELHELRTQLAEREGHETEKAAALRRAHDCYNRFGMTAQAARVAKELGKESGD